MTILYVIEELCYDEEDNILLSSEPVQVWDNFSDAEAEYDLLRNLAPADYKKYYHYSLTPLYLNKADSNFDIKLYCIELSENGDTVSRSLYEALNWESINADPAFWLQKSYVIISNKENSAKIYSSKGYEHGKACAVDYSSLPEEYKQALYELVVPQ